MTTILNLTPHPVLAERPDGTLWSAEPVDPEHPAHCAEIVEVLGELEEVPLVRLRYGQVSNLPPPRPDVFYLVSLPVMLACPQRRDLLVPAQQERHGDRRCHAFAVTYSAVVVDHQGGS